MVSPFTLPPIGFGPGSLPDQEGELQYMPMPSGMRVYVPHIPDAGDAAALPEAMAMLSDMARAYDTLARGDAAVSFELTTLSVALGDVAVTILSRGYGSCRVTSCAQSHVWKVQFFNSMDTLILDTYEVCEIPEGAIAAVEDLVDSATRIRDAIEASR